MALRARPNVVNGDRRGRAVDRRFPATGGMLHRIQGDDLT